MERKFYHAFYRRSGSIFLSHILAKICYALMLARYCLLKHRRGSHMPAGMGEMEAEEAVSAASPPPDITFPAGNDRGVQGEDAPDLSVIVPVYNYVKVLKNCLDSIVSQKTRYRYEMLFVDDGSTDGSGELLRAYEGMDGVTVIRQENSGISAARNAALDRARGRYIMFVDCDDYLEPDAAEVLLGRAYEQDCDIVEGAYYTFGQEGGPKREAAQKGILLTEPDYSALMAYTGYPWAKVYKRELFSRVRFPENAWFEDTLVKIILFRSCGRYSYLPQPIYGYRKYEGNFTETQVKSSRGLEHYWLLCRMAAFSQEEHIGSGESLYLALLYHLGAIYQYRIASTEDSIQRAAFVLGGALLRKYRPAGRGSMRLPFMLGELEKAYSDNDYAWWKLICRFM